MQKNLERFLREEFMQNLNEGWYTVEPHPEKQGTHIVTAINNKTNPHKHVIGSDVSKGDYELNQYTSDGDAYSSAPAPAAKKPAVKKPAVKKPATKSKTVREETLDERKSSDPKGVAYAITRDSHAAYPEWGPANHASDPATDFGHKATRSSAAAAIKAMRKLRGKNGKVDGSNPEHIEHISKSIHGSPEDFGGKAKGWSKAAIDLGEPYQTAEKKSKRAKLTGPYGGLDDSEKEKDRVIARTVVKHFAKKKP